MDELDALGPLDGRYNKDTRWLASIFSERGFISYRLQIEAEYLLYLSGHKDIKLRAFTPAEEHIVTSLYDFDSIDARLVKEIETTEHGNMSINNGKKTNHDVKAIEYYIKERLKETTLRDCLEWVHFGLTSEDVNNIAYGMMLSDAIGQHIIPTVSELYSEISVNAQTYKDVPILARTHGQPASPTTFGKEFKVYASRLERQIASLTDQTISVKLNGATGNYNALYAACPDIDWQKFTAGFVGRMAEGRKLMLVPNEITTQIEPHDSYAELFDNLRRINTILIDFDQDMWRYISDDWLSQKMSGDAGSSTMPHKINPIDFENSEGNLGIANALLSHFSTKLPISRLQRDLSDSTVERNFGVALGHTLLGYISAKKGLSKVSVNEEKVRSELDNHPEVVAEAIQTILRREGAEQPYEQLKKLTRGEKITKDDITAFIEGLDVSSQLKDELRAITPQNYTGIATFLAGKK